MAFAVLAAGVPVGHDRLHDRPDLRSQVPLDLRPPLRITGPRWYGRSFDRLSSSPRAADLDHDEGLHFLAPATTCATSRSLRQASDSSLVPRLRSTWRPSYGGTRIDRTLVRTRSAFALSVRLPHCSWLARLGHWRCPLAPPTRVGRGDLLPAARQRGSARFAVRRRQRRRR